MKLSGINTNCAFKALFIHPKNAENTKNFLKQYKKVVDNAAKDKDLYITSDNYTVETGPDFSILKPVINVAIYPKEIINDNNEIKIDKKQDTVMYTAFSYIPSTSNEKNRKFAEVLEKSISLIG